ncbi:MAG: hypothetical protein BA871_11450 [Desulfuromonadales bacterium C00003096]|jgi:hypothetical protein|nr:MAG: hypothetical protein BA871_11450 [Desulfuromonadales bacterium C00003096]
MPINWEKGGHMAAFLLPTGLLSRGSLDRFSCVTIFKPNRFVVNSTVTGPAYKPETVEGNVAVLQMRYKF